MDIIRERSYHTPVADSPLLPLLLLSLMRQKNSPNVSGIRRKEYDFIVVGAGSGGATVAARLSEIPCVNVLLLEAGKTPPVLSDVPAYQPSFVSSDIAWQYYTVPQKHTAEGMINRQLPWRSGKVLGGTSVLVSMMYVRGNRNNYDDWARQGAVGWSYYEVLPYFKKMEDNKNIREVDAGYHGTGGPMSVETVTYRTEIIPLIVEAAKAMGYKVTDSNGRTQTGLYNLQSTMRDGQKCSTAKAYLVPAENRPNLDILNEAHVKKILIEDGRATGVIFQHANVEHTVRATSEVILSAGTVNTAQLLMLSGIGPRDHLEDLNIPVVADLPVGNNLQDHPSVNIHFHSTLPAFSDIAKKESSLSEYIDNRTGPLTCPLTNSLVQFWKDEIAEPEVDLPSVEMYFVQGSVNAYKKNPLLKPEVYKKAFEPYENKPVWICSVRPLQIRSRGTVRLNSTDPFDTPLVDPNYFQDIKDVEDMVQGIKVCNEIGKSPQLRKIGSKPLEALLPNCKQFENDEDRYFECYLRTIPIPSNNQVGTAKMGDPDDPSTVVDPQLRVKGVRGLRVVDASVMPIIPSGNTNIPTIMVAEKAADIIKKDIVCPLNTQEQEKIHEDYLMYD